MWINFVQLEALWYESGKYEQPSDYVDFVYI